MIQTTLGEIVNAYPVLVELSHERVSAKTAYSIHKLLNLLAKDNEHFEKQRADAVRELGKDEGNGVVTVLPDNMSEFQSRMQHLVSVPVEVLWTPLHLDDLVCPIQGAQVGQLGPFLVAE